MRIYLDHAATTPLCEEAREAMLPWLGAHFGNPSSIHEAGRQARAALDEAREVLAGVLGCRFGEVVFTSGGTEGANAAIVGAARQYKAYGRSRVLVGAAEHHCVLHTQPILEELGYRVEMLPVDRIGRVRLDALDETLGPDVLLVSVMHANNELGTIQPAEDVARRVRACGALYHCDAVQTFCNLPADHASGRSAFPTAYADVVSVSAHKINGPKGVGALYVKSGVKLKPLIAGGGQERELRAGTENVAGIVGFAAAVKAAEARKEASESKLKARDTFLDRLAEAAPFPYVPTVPDRADALSGHAHLRFPGVGAESLLMVLDMMGVAASGGAACSSGSLAASHVMLACGYPEAEAKEGVRFTFGWDTTEDEAREAAERVARAVKQISRRSTL